LQKFEIKQEEINTLNSKINNFQNIIAIKDEQFRLQRELTDSLVKELKGEKRKIFLYKVGTVVGGIGTFLMLVK
jgi:PDZ domain-containing secreted protein